MKAIVLETPGKLRAAIVDGARKPDAGEALVRVCRIGVCGTDLHAFAGRQPYFTYPRRLGHELGVEVVEVGRDVVNVAVGERCAVLPYVNCGECLACRNGKTNCCVNLSVLGVHADGGMCEYLTVPARLLVKSEALSFDQLALVEPLSIGAHAVSRAVLRAGEWALVVGVGPIGLATAQFALAAGAQVIAMDLSQPRLNFCREQLGVRHCVSASNARLEQETRWAQPTLLEQVNALVNGDLPTAVFDCTGSKASMERSFQYVAHGGRLIFVGLVQGDISFADPHFHRRELTLLASRNATFSDFQQVIGAIESGVVDVRPWITHRSPFDDFIDHFTEWNDPNSGIIKGLIELD